MLKLREKLLWIGLGCIQFLMMSTVFVPSATAQSGCLEAEANLSNQSAPSPENREIRSSRHFFKLQIPANYRAIAENNSLLIFSPEAYAYHLCKPPSSTFYMAAWVDIVELEVPPSISLNQAFDSFREQPEFRMQGNVQNIIMMGQPALRVHYEKGGDGLARHYILHSPQRTKLIIIGSWVDSVNEPDPDVLRRMASTFELIYSAMEKSPRIGIVPSLDVCGLAVWQRSGDKLTHFLTAQGGDSFANIRLNNQLLRLRATGGQIMPEQTRKPSNFTFQSSDRSITVTLRGSWQIESPGAQAGWITNNATLEVTQGSQTSELPVVASLGCDFASY